MSDYRVLARTYRPTTFEELVGQEALVRTLTHAIAAQRIPHAFLLTGIRGIGKTTTARIIARALNCETGPTATPCGTCGQCVSIAEDRNPDVIEMDAASRTGVNDIRELIETVRYLPVSARNKVYIIDEVHMLSTSAFNALLKTLEEPPPHVVFIFATTELRKIPVTILSRCMRFDLRRLDAAGLALHLKTIADKEEIEAEAEALALITAAAEGSVRDGLSLLDQAIAHGGGTVTAAAVQTMLGLADRARTFALFETLMEGKAHDALSQWEALHADGADPVLTIQDLLKAAHLLSRMQVHPALKDDASLPQNEREFGARIAPKLSQGVLSRAWQMLLKGTQEVKTAPDPRIALEMVLIRLCYAGDLPTPGELARLANPDAATSPAAAQAATPPAVPSAPTPTARSEKAGRSAPRAQAQVAAAFLDAAQGPQSFPEVVALFAEHREAMLHHTLRHEVRLAAFASGTIELEPFPSVAPDFAGQVSARLKAWTGQPWVIVIAEAPAGTPTLAEAEAAAQEKEREDVAAHPLVAKVLAAFPEAKIVRVHEAQAHKEDAEPAQTE